MADKDTEITDEELNDIFEEDILVDDTEGDTEGDTEDSDLTDDTDEFFVDEDESQEEEVIDINKDEFLNELVEEGEDVVIENVNQMLNEYKFTRTAYDDKYRYLFDNILSKYWYSYVLDEEKRENPDMNMYYRWLSVIDFNDLMKNESWEKFILTDGNGEKLIEEYENADLPELDETLDELYEKPTEEEVVAPELELEDVVDDNEIDIDAIEEKVASENSSEADGEVDLEESESGDAENDELEKKDQVPE